MRSARLGNLAKLRFVDFRRGGLLAVVELDLVLVVPPSLG
jgi:hypothetical protein